jgi:hypothetical protein
VVEHGQLTELVPGDYIFWCRHNRAIWWIGRRVCALLGHSVLQHPKNGEGQYVETEAYCYRCLAEFTIRKAWPEEDRP